ncbi:DUF2987 domain-containing protein [Aeromonas simiae]|uniref:DUF2987 domain-containing protein n=1 Tax=Aeromonas simiae TaxID=218936 RepID=UPI0038D0F049
MKSAWMGALLLAGGASAWPLEISYADFYGPMQRAAKGEFGLARLGFYLTDQQNGRRCAVLGGSVETLDRHVPIPITADAELRLPYDEGLNLDKAKVVLELGDESQCSLSVQVMAELSPGLLQVATLEQAQGDMLRLLEQMSGRLGRLFLPEMQGVRLEMLAERGEGALQVQGRRQTLAWKAHQLTLDKGSLAAFSAGTLQLDSPVLRLTPWLPAR